MSERNFNVYITHQPELGDVLNVELKKSGDGGEMLLQFAPSRGFNLFKLKAWGQDFIWNSISELKDAGFSGVPILYPTPNRVRGASFEYQGHSFYQEKHGVPRLLHGLVYDEPWSFTFEQKAPDSVRIEAWIDFLESFSAFGSFPFPHRLSIEYSISPYSVQLNYTVRNYSRNTIPFGFAIHPYFPTRIDGVSAHIHVPATHMFESDRDRFPTGKIIAVGETPYDLQMPRQVGQLDLDDVYTGMSGKTATISYSEKYTLALTASSEFQQMVVYTPANREYFCLENQTCMTDAHNQYNTGRRKESGLLLVEPDSEFSGWIRLQLDRQKA